ncbi:sigma-70 family RNA polymerase sigma factor [Microlunatus sp. GCM10028923]|uniref:sigma-70 family RNA polymerase sigma factor n=1 Tax=Microlunatus sp. GCM10028923 TaxID=3273400 RepID=UPI003619A2C3
MTFTDLYPELLTVCSRLARRILGDDDLAHQVAAEALLRLYEHWNDLTDSPGHRRAWALRVTRNLAIDEIRAQARHRPLADVDSEVLDSTSEWLLWIVVLNALDDLSPGQRRSVELRYLQDLSQTAAAKVLGVEPGTVATHTSRALAQLRRRLSSEAPRPSTEPTKENPIMKVTDLSHAKQLIGTDQTITAQLLDRLDKDKIMADIGIEAVYRRRGQLPDTDSGTSAAVVECTVIDMYDDRRPLITNAPDPQAEGHSDLGDRLRSLMPGQQAVGTVRKVLPFGAFVEFDGLRCLIHASDLSPDRLLKPGEELEIVITDVDLRLARIGARPAHQRPDHTNP